MYITAYTNTYLKMTSEETSTENCELVIKSLGGQVICQRLSMRLLVHYTMPDFLAPACKSWSLLCLLFNVTPQAFSHQTCLPKYMTPSIGPGFLQPKSWLLRHHDWTSSYIVWEWMCTYQDIDATIVWVVRQSLQHLWYLTEHLVILPFFLVWRTLWLHNFICILQYLSMLSRSHERSMGTLPLSMLSIWFSFRWLVISQTLWCLWMSLSLIQSFYTF